MKKIFSGITLFALVVLFGGRAVVGHAQDAAAPGSADQAAQQAPADQTQQAQDQPAQDFSADVSTGQQQLAQDPNADTVQVSIVNAEDQSAGDSTNSDIPLFTGIDQAQVDSQSATPDSSESTDLTTSEVTQELDANNLSADTQTVIDAQQEQDQQAQDQQSQDQTQQQQDQTQQTQDQTQQTQDQSQPTPSGDTGGGTGQ